MTFASFSSSSSRRWALVGRGDVADAVAAAWNRPEALVQWDGFDAQAPWVDGVILTETRLKSAYDMALGVLARGIPLVVTHPQLLAVHGRILEAAASSTGAVVRAEPVLFGGILGDGWRAGNEVVATWGGAADRFIQRMVETGDAPERAEKLVRWSGEMGDWDGRQTQAAALALHGAWVGYGAAPAVTRVGVDALTDGAMRAVAGMGLRMRYGAVMTAGEVVVGPVVLDARAALASFDHTGVMAEGAFGPQACVTAARPLQQTVGGVMQAVALGRGRAAAPFAPPAPVAVAWQDFGGVRLPFAGEAVALRKTA